MTDYMEVNVHFALQSPANPSVHSLMIVVGLDVACSLHVLLQGLFTDLLSFFSFSFFTTISSAYEK